jgi:hypothetical protein
MAFPSTVVFELVYADGEHQGLPYHVGCSTDLQCPWANVWAARHSNDSPLSIYLRSLANAGRTPMTSTKHLPSIAMPASSARLLARTRRKTIWDWYQGRPDWWLSGAPPVRKVRVSHKGRLFDSIMAASRATGAARVCIDRWTKARRNGWERL